MNKENFINKKVVLDARSPAQLLYMLSYIESNKTIQDVVVLWAGKPELIESLGKYIHLPEVKNISNINPSDSNILFNYPLFFSINKKISNISGQIILFTAFNHGVYFSMIKKKLSLSYDSIYLFDDGSLNILQKYNSKKILRAFLYSFHGLIPEYSKYRLFCNEKYNNIFTIFSRSILPECVRKKQIINISKYVNNSYNFLFKNIYKNKVQPNSALLLTHHAVESDRLTLKEYQTLIVDVVKEIRSHGVGCIYLSKHHLEKNINTHFYKSLNLIFINEDFPAEILLSSSNIKIMAQPYNSTPLVASSIGLMSNLNTIISYKIKHSPHIESRVNSIDNIAVQHNLNHHKL